MPHGGKSPEKEARNGRKRDEKSESRLSWVDDDDLALEARIQRADSATPDGRILGGGNDERVEIRAFASFRWPDPIAEA